MAKTNTPEQGKEDTRKLIGRYAVYFREGKNPEIDKWLSAYTALFSKKKEAEKYAVEKLDTIADEIPGKIIQGRVLSLIEKKAGVSE